MQTIYEASILLVDDNPDLLVLVGDEEAVAQMPANNRQQRRYSGLRWRLAQNNG